MQTLLHLVGILFPHINDDARSKSHQINFCLFTCKITFWDTRECSQKQAIL